ncbi:class D sortase [Clostridium sp.]|uniref:class D sortase n=1 Tax=Clostridium sp. TaxID=1506 RepID=UPI0026257BAB|nr:class D sortase [Clostridium sp.]
MRNKISKLVFFIGLSLVSIVLISKIYTNSIENKAINSLKEKIASSDKEKELFLKEGIKVGDEIALIDIDKIGIHSVVLEGSSLDVLEHNIGHFENTAMPGESGNFGIAGHRNNINNEVFRDINKLEIGDKIKITTIKDSFEYEVNNISVISPQEVEVLSQNIEKKEMTIVTCTNRGKKRHIVRAKLLS